MSDTVQQHVAFELAVVRHGRTAWNADGRFQGHTDVPLDDTGRAQAAGLAALIAEFPIARAVSSDLARARETCEIVLAGRDVPIALDAGWREMRFGPWEGLTWPQIVERFPDVDAANRTVPKFYTPEGGETFDDVCERVRHAVARIAATAADGDRILVATHAGAMHALLRVVLGESEATALGVKFAPATLTRIAFDGSGARLIDLNHTPDAQQMSAGRSPIGE